MEIQKIYSAWGLNCDQWRFLFGLIWQPTTLPQCSTNQRDHFASKLTQINWLRVLFQLVPFLTGTIKNSVWYIKKVRTDGFWSIIGIHRGYEGRFCTVLIVPAVSTNANPVIPLSRNRQTIRLVPRSGREGHRTLANGNIFYVEYTACF